MTARKPEGAHRDRPVDADELALVLSALADAGRLRMLALLRTGDRCVCEIHQSLGLTPPNVSHHLALLRRAGLVTRRRDRYWVHYELAEHRCGAVRPLVDALVACVAASAQGRADRARLAALPACCAHPRRPSPSASRPSPLRASEATSSASMAPRTGHRDVTGH